MDKQQNKTLEISSRRASSFFNFDESMNFDEVSRPNRDRRPRVCGVTNKVLNGRTLNFNETYYIMVMRVLGDAGPEAAGSR